DDYDDGWNTPDHPLTYALAADVQHGTLTFDAADGSYTYAPSADYHGWDSFTFTADDGALQTPGRVTFDVIGDAEQATSDVYYLAPGATTSAWGNFGITANDA